MSLPGAHPCLFLLTWLPLVAAAGPVVVPTAQGQIGEVPSPGDTVAGAAFEPLPAGGNVLLGGLFEFGGVMAPPSLFEILTDQLPEPSTPASVTSSSETFNSVFKLAPRSASSVGLGGTESVAFSFAFDGTDPNTMAIGIEVFDAIGGSLSNTTIDNVPSFPDPALSDTGVAVDDQGRVTVVYTNFPNPMPPRIRAQRYDGVTGQPLGAEIAVTDDPNAFPDIALIDRGGVKLIAVSAGLSTNNLIKGNIIDTTGPIAMVLPSFPISTTAALQNLNPTVAADPATGAFVVAWEHITGAAGNPIDVRARRFDAMGNPIGDDFVVNTTTANAQGQPDVDAGPSGETVIVWAGDQVDLDVFGQLYDASGNPIGGEFQVNSVTTGKQSLPSVRFLPDSDAQGRVQFAVVWRDAVSSSDPTPNGTGTSYRCFSIDDDPPEIFEDGFESGDTSSWSCSQP